MFRRQRAARKAGTDSGNLKRIQSEKYPVFLSAENFFQLPAMLSWCDLIISVETAVMHLANAVHVPVIALMRQKILNGRRSIRFIAK
jgi:ADP-heptose:LPS heptosyltransferase